LGQGFLRNYFMQGFVPADETLLFRQKCSKPFPPVRGPSGTSASTPNQDGSGTRCAQTAFAKGVDSVFRLRRSRRRKDTSKNIELQDWGIVKTNTTKTHYACQPPIQVRRLRRAQRGRRNEHLVFRTRETHGKGMVHQFPNPSFPTFLIGNPGWTLLRPSYV